MTTPPRGAMVARFASALALALAGVGCERPPAESGPPRMEVSEQERGLALCRGYAERVCACAHSDAALQRECRLAPSREQGLRLHMGLLGGQKGRLNDGERMMTEESAREIIAACVAADGRLDPGTCPRARAPTSR